MPIPPFPRLWAQAFALALAGGSAATALAGYPETPAKPVVDNYHGTSVTDPYRWMEDMKSPEFQAWIKAQAGYAAAQLKAIPGRDALRTRLGQLADSGEQTGAYEMVAGKLFYTKRTAGQNQGRLWLREGLEGPERELLDPNNLPGEPGRHAFDWRTTSPDGRYVALGVSSGGSEDSVLRVFDVKAGRFLPDTIDRAGLNDEGLAWLPDASGFFYNRLPVGERYNKSAVYLHKLGTEVDKDKAIFGWQVPGLPAFAVPDLPKLSLDKGSRWALVQVRHGDAVDRSYWVAPLSDLLTGGKPAWRRIISADDKISTAVLAGDEVFALSQRKASRRELVRVDLNRKVLPLTSPSDLKVALAAPLSNTTLSVTPSVFEPVMPASDAVLQDLDVGDDALYVKGLQGGVSRLWRVARQGHKVAALSLPFEGTVRNLTPLPGGELLLQEEGWAQPPQSLVLNTAKPGEAPRRINLQKPLALDVSGIEARQVMVKSHDGVMVPLSLILPKGRALDGRLPTILNGYGAYGITQEPRFAATRLAWLEKGGAFAVCHVRGGGELGEEWHQGGYIATKQNTVSDFIACAQWLIANKVTTPALLAGTGGSAGGITIGGAITQRPELFAAAQSSVGLSDMLRMELTPNGAPNVAEFGTVTNPAHFKSMYAISPYHRVKEGVNYPAVIVTTGANDPRVEAWIPAKFAARLQAANPKGKPALLRVDFEAGHGMGSGVSQRLDETADVWSFFLAHMGQAGFAPSAPATPGASAAQP